MYVLIWLYFSIFVYKHVLSIQNAKYVFNEVDYRLDVCTVINGAQIERYDILKFRLTRFSRSNDFLGFINTPEMGHKNLG